MSSNYPYKEITQIYLNDPKPEKLNGRLILMEEKFFFAHLCWKRLENRSVGYGKVLDSVPVDEIFSNKDLRELHADEHFFFQCCGDIHKELKYQIENKVFSVPTKLMEKLKVLNMERHVHTHGVDRYWNPTNKRNPPIPTKGDNYDFDQNMELLNKIYGSIVKSLKS